eukprot:GHVL01037483.1.p1 GENE.GHVL01037483.1~~GHVL01037483.1.p1  ORF type:complete len:958 (+),score=139.01 GHVL01037483.1:102-2975(+)
MKGDSCHEIDQSSATQALISLRKWCLLFLLTTTDIRHYIENGTCCDYPSLLKAALIFINESWISKTARHFRFFDNSLKDDFVNLLKNTHIGELELFATYVKCESHRIFKKFFVEKAPNSWELTCDRTCFFGFKCNENISIHKPPFYLIFTSDDKPFFQITHLDLKSLFHNEKKKKAKNQHINYLYEDTQYKINSFFDKNVIFKIVNDKWFRMTRGRARWAKLTDELAMGCYQRATIVLYRRIRTEFDEKQIEFDETFFENKMEPKSAFDLRKQVRKNNPWESDKIKILEEKLRQSTECNRQLVKIENSITRWDEIDAWTRSNKCGNPRHIGMPNHGNYCFMNAVVQCFNHCSGLVEFVHSPNSDSDSILLKHFIKIKQATGYSFLTPLDDVFSKMNPGMTKGLQQDAAEYFNNFLSYSEDRELEMRGLNNEDMSVEEKKKSAIGRMFCGITQHSLMCLGCNEKNNTYSYFFGLPLRVEDCYSVKDSLRDYPLPEKLEGTSKCYCKRCKDKHEAIRQSILYDLPFYFTVQIVRFGVNGEKIHEGIEIEEFLKLDDFVYRGQQHCIDKSEYEYELYGIVSHLGNSISCGHYIAHTKCPKNNQWRKFDDSSVCEVSTEPMLNTVSSTCVLLFYKKKQTDTNNGEAADSYNELKELRICDNDNDSGLGQNVSFSCDNDNDSGLGQNVSFSCDNDIESGLGQHVSKTPCGEADKKKTDDKAFQRGKNSILENAVKKVGTTERQSNDIKAITNPIGSSQSTKREKDNIDKTTTGDSNILYRSTEMQPRNETTPSNTNSSPRSIEDWELINKSSEETQPATEQAKKTTRSGSPAATEQTTRTTQPDSPRVTEPTTMTLQQESPVANEQTTRTTRPDSPLANEQTTMTTGPDSPVATEQTAKSTRPQSPIATEPTTSTLGRESPFASGQTAMTLPESLVVTEQTNRILRPESSRNTRSEAQPSHP